MKKVMVLSVCTVLAFSSCNTYTAEGAYVGSSFGSILGSAIGGISGGYRGSDIGTIVGMAGGAVVGAAIGSAADQAKQNEYKRAMEDRAADYRRNATSPRGGASAYGSDTGESGFDPTNSGDDRIEFDGQQGASSEVYTTVAPRSLSVGQLKAVAPGYSLDYNKLIEVRNASFVDRDGDGVIRRGETCQVTFEIMNRSSVALYDVQPTVVETTGNKHIHISPPLRVESIAPGSGVRYTASVYADNRLKEGRVVIRVAVAQGNNEITSHVKEFDIVTRKK